MDFETSIDPFDNKTKEIARLFDAATDQKNVKKLKELIQKSLDLILNVNEVSKAHLHYSIGTAYGEIAQLQTKHEEDNIKQRLYHFRKSLTNIEADELQEPEYFPYIIGFKLSLYTNYANVLDQCGRKIAAIEYYQKALKFNPNFGMASGNLGIAYNHYAKLISNDLHRDFLNQFAYVYLCDAIKSNDANMVEAAVEKYEEIIAQYNIDYVEQVLKLPFQIPKYKYSNKNEKEYRKWAIENKLFLNPLNDLPVFEFYFAADVITLPPIIASSKSRIDFHGIFNQIKQEFVYARFLCYSSLSQTGTPHYADKNTNLIDPMDYSQYSIRLEMLKSSFKTLYSLLDKIAYFLNIYFELGIQTHDISFYRIWKHEKRSKSGHKYHSSLKPKENFALSSLYWISRDFYEKFVDSPNPHAEHIKNIRNALEHRFVKILMFDYSNNVTHKNENLTALALSENELYSQTLALLKILREAILCLSLTVGIEENKRHISRDPDDIILPIKLAIFEDEWKC